MRNFIIGLSILFFALSGIIIIKALGIPVKQARYQNNPIELKANIEPERPEKKIRVLAVFGGGTFRSGQVVIKSDMMNAVDELVPEMLAYPDNRIVIEGHTDNIPIKALSGRRYRDNMELSFLRAKAIADILVTRGISLERISVIGSGDTRPIDSNETDEGRVKNRRVEVRLIPGDMEF